MGKGSKSSRKGKKAWRANISTEDIEDFFEKTTKDALSGGNLSAAPSEDLFRVEKSHDLPVKRKIEKSREKVLRCDSVLKKNPFVQVVSSSKPKSKISKKKKTNAVESKTPKQAQSNVDDDSVMMDLWGDDNKGEDESNPRKIWKMTTTIPAVEVDPAGCSYNPTAESHEDMLAEAVAQEMQKVYKTELGPEPVPLTIDGNNNIEDEAGLLSVCNRIINGKSAYFLGVDNGSEGEEEADAANDVSEAGNKTARTTKRVTRVVLNKRARQKALRKEETKEKHKEKLSKEIDRYFELMLLKILFLLFFYFCSLPKIIKEIAEDDKEKLNKKIRQTIAKEEVLKIRPPRLGKHKYEAPPVQVLLTEEMTGSLRKLKACCTLARDRFKSLEKRGILVPSKTIRRN
ncbi:ribosome biogenesis protein NOP53-like isoform X1 [Brassica napus]|uniref:ribosome biogenesis protein NOP53-like isoform X1 n=1 Tax=Brassica napus TaxID=3708 RepID=UPI0020796704|nr:ribosome biogenesis protein NOP53-like isoform X1 [Brassica napus]